MKFPQPVQDALELRNYIKDRIAAYEKETGKTVLNTEAGNLGVAIQNFRSDKTLQYTLFDNRIRYDMLRKTMYNIKDMYGKNIVRKAVELFQPEVMRDAVGFGSIKDMINGETFNQYAIEQSLYQ
jgi:DNA polymerase-4